jgi:cell wall-associated NlpC family hydrolase
LTIPEPSRDDRDVTRPFLALVLAASALGCSSTSGTTRLSASGGIGATSPAGVGPRTEAALAFANAQVGKRYCWGGTGPSCFDCSGLVQAAWRSAGVRLPRTSTDQAHVLAQIRPEEVQPGDVLWWPHHVGLYAGNGEMIDAYHSGAGVVRRPAALPERVYRVVP